MYHLKPFANYINNILKNLSEWYLDYWLENLNKNLKQMEYKLYKFNYSISKFFLIQIILIDCKYLLAND